MKVIEILKTALISLFSNKIRSFLTMLGVIIGVFAVVTLVSLVQGVRNYVMDQFNALGSNLLYVIPGSGGFTQDPAVSFSNNKLKDKHIDLIKEDAKGYAEYVIPIIETAKPATYKSKRYYATVSGVIEGYDKVIDMKFKEGAFFSRTDNKSASRVVVLGYEVKDELFKNSTALGKEINVDGKAFKVIGVLEKKSEDFDIRVYIPYETVKKTLDADRMTYITIKVKPGKDLDLASKNITVSLLKDLKRDDFTVYTQKDMLKAVEDILGILSVSLGAIAGISLLVGGIGIMNIMLVSVTERTQEVGLRKSLGATGRDIGLQFIVESVMLSFSGGFLGLMFGFLATLIAQKWIRAEVTVWSVVLAFSFAAVVGVIFGTYPAIKAAKKDPIESLRYE